MTAKLRGEKSETVRRVQRLLTVPSVMLASGMAGCRRAPTFNILGSFFPSWLICLFAGIVLAAVVNRIFVRVALDKEILWPVVVYPCLALLFACALWLVLFS
jgi:YtcA family